MKKLAYSALLALSVLSPMATAETAVSQPATTRVVEKAKGIWIDVRTPEEYAEGHITDAINIPVNEIADKIAQVSPNKDAPVNLYCKLGIRAEQARKILVAQGYTNVTNQGGYQELLKKGLK